MAYGNEFYDDDDEDEDELMAQDVRRHGLSNLLRPLVQLKRASTFSRIACTYRIRARRSRTPS